jgi:dipeptidyl aminopeptidase/acylaminoacyl peptidase
MMFYRRQAIAAVSGGICAVLRGVSSALAQAVIGRGERSGSKEALLIPRRRLFADPAKSVVRISPDGRRIAWLAPLDGVLNLFVAPLDDVGEARALTRVTDRSLGPGLLWLHNNRHVVFFREQGGDENWKVHRVDVETGDILALTPAPGVSAFVHQTSHHFPDELLIAHNARDKQFFDIYRVNVATGTSKLIQVNDRFAGFFTDPRFKVRFAVRFADNGDVEYLRPAAGGEWEPFTRIDSEDVMTTRPIEFSDDGRELYWLDSRGRDKAAVTAQDVANDDVAKDDIARDLVAGAMRILAEDPRADIVELPLDPKSYRPIAAAAMFTRKTWHVIDRDYAEDFALLARLFDGDLSLVSLSNDRRHAIVYYEHDDAPGRYVHYDRTERKARFLFSMRPALENLALVVMEPAVLHARDGLPLVCYLSRPHGWRRHRPSPMVLLVHGGPWGRDVWALYPTHQWLADRGYAVLSVNYRGSTGFGKAFVNAANLEWAGKMHDDLIDAVDWAVARGIADAKRVAIYGASYGGYAALVGVTFTPEKFACAIDVFGISNLLTFIATVPDYWKPWQTVWKVRMGDYTTEAGRTFLEARSPLNHVDRIVRPLMIAQGENDVRVKPQESNQIVTAMQARNIPVTYVYYPDEGHGFRREENRRSFNAVLELFLAKHLGGRAEPVGDDFAGSSIEFRAGRDLIPGLDEAFRNIPMGMHHDP